MNLQYALSTYNEAYTDNGLIWMHIDAFLQGKYRLSTGPVGTGATRYAEAESFPALLALLPPADRDSDNWLIFDGDGNVIAQ